MLLLNVTNSSLRERCSFTCVLLLNNYVYLINPVRIRFRRPANPKCAVHLSHSASKESEQTANLCRRQLLIAQRRCRMNAFADEGGKQSQHREEIMNAGREDGVRKGAKEGLNAGP